MKRRSVIALALALFFLPRLNAQNRGYVIQGDSLYIEGKIKYNYTRPTEVELKSGKKQRVIYTADQVTEFSNKEEGIVFKSTRLLLNGRYQNVFLERVEAGPLELYQLAFNQPRFYLKTDSLITLTRDNYREQISNWNDDCTVRAQQYKLVRYRRQYLANFVRDYNAQQCRNLPFLNVGISVDYARQQLRLPEDSYTPLVAGAYPLTNSNLSIALFADQPLWKLPNFSLTGEIGFAKNNFYAELFTPTLNQDIKVEMTNIHLALAPRYTLNTHTFRPYFLAGGVLSYTARSSSQLLQARLEGSVITIEPFDPFIPLPDLLYGFTYGAGVQCFYTYNHFLALEFSSRRLSGKQVDLTGNHLKIKVNL